MAKKKDKKKLLMLEAGLPVVGPPGTKKELIRRIKNILGTEHLIYPSPICSKGTGAPGEMLEILLGSEGNSKAIADAVGTEIKYLTPGGSLLTLFHKEVDGGNRSIRDLMNRFGYIDEESGRRKIYHTITPTSDLFRIVRSGGKVAIRARSTGEEYFWTEDTLVTSAARKLGDVILVCGSVTRRGSDRCVRFDSAKHLFNFRTTDFLNALGGQFVLVDLDASQNSPGSFGIHNRGTKFRMDIKDWRELWGSIETEDTIDRWTIVR